MQHGYIGPSGILLLYLSVSLRYLLLDRCTIPVLTLRPNSIRTYPTPYPLPSFYIRYALRPVAYIYKLY